MRIGGSILIAAAVFLLTAPRSPAPIVEETTPRPTVAPRPEAKPKRAKSHAAPKPTSEPKQERSANKIRFAGKWVGTMSEVPWGNVATELTVDQAEATMHWQESGQEKGLAKASVVNGNTLQANFVVGVAETWSITPLSDGTTARVRLQAFMNDQTAIFHRLTGTK
jgi:hypothetical protein